MASPRLLKEFGMLEAVSIEYVSNGNVPADSGCCVVRSAEKIVCNRLSESGHMRSKFRSDDGTIILISATEDEAQAEDC